MGKMTSDLSEINELDDNNILSTPEDYLPHPKNYKNWFSFYDEIDLRRSTSRCRDCSNRRST